MKRVFWSSSVFVISAFVYASGKPANTVIAAGGQHSLAIKADGTLLSWGDRQTGQLGDGSQMGVFNSNAAAASPVVVKNANRIVAVATGNVHSLAVQADGTVLSWGGDGTGQLGNGGDNTNQAVPSLVKDLSQVIAVAGGYYHSLALKADGTVFAWGGNDYGQLGNGTRDDQKVPVQVKGANNVIAIASGDHFSLALKSDGTILAWGRDSLGQLGDGLVDGEFNAPQQTVPVQVKGASKIIAIAAGGAHALALKSDGTVLAWGTNERGQIGDGTNERRSEAVLVKGVNNIVAIAAGKTHSLALKSDGTVLAWGDDSNGQIGDGGTPMLAEQKPLAVVARGAIKIVAIAAGKAHSLALKSDGTLLAWGTNESGQIGSGRTSEQVFNVSTPVSVLLEANKLKLP
jgi:alpha-tubulin suppressor-like RCC1 family protein